MNINATVLHFSQIQSKMSVLYLMLQLLLVNVVLYLFFTEMYTFPWYFVVPGKMLRISLTSRSVSADIQTFDLFHEILLLLGPAVGRT